MTGLPLGTVKSRTLYAMRNLRAQLQGDVTSEEECGL
jgi:DNA-directed RNA polymerase specialized sigma24 family protein